MRPTIQTVFAFDPWEIVPGGASPTHTGKAGSHGLIGVLG